MTISTLILALLLLFANPNQKSKAKAKGNQRQKFDDPIRVTGNLKIKSNNQIMVYVVVFVW
jgi:hypothetical protein